MKQRTDQRGVIGILGILIYSAVVVLIGTTMTTTAVLSLNSANKRLNTTQSLFNAESGAEDALLQVSRDANFGSSTLTWTTMLDPNNSVQTQVQPDASCSGGRTVTASGYNGNLVRRVQLTNCNVSGGGGSTASFNYAMQADTGGIRLRNNSRITGGTYSNGSIVGENSNNLNGDVTVANETTVTQATAFDPVATADFTFGNVSNRTDAAQSFAADTSSSNQILKVQLKVRKIGNPQNATVRLATDNGGKPSSTSLATGTLFASATATSFGWVDVGFGAPATLSNGTKYWIVIDVPSTNGSNYWSWASDSSLAGQTLQTSTGWPTTSWTDGATDGAFRTLMGATPTSLSGVVVNGSSTTRANTITNSTINGPAFFQGASNTTFNGSVNPGAADSPQRDLPITQSQIDGFKTEAASGGTINGNFTVTNNGQASLGPKKVTGNLTVSNNATLTVTGTIWVVGSINFTNNATVKLSSTLGPNSAVIYSDSPVQISNNINVTGLNNNAIFLITNDASDSAMVVSNNANGIVFYAPNGRLYMNNNASGNAAAANRILLENNATLTYASFLGNITFTGGGNVGRQTKGWKEILQ